MKNVLLIGDSIRQGYDKAVKKALEGKANVYFPEDNCRFSAHILRHVDEYCGMIKDAELDIIHWNCGLWDCVRQWEEDPHTPPDIYAYYIERICIRIKKLYPNAKVFFATTTRVIEDQMNKNFKRCNSDIEEYNRIATDIVKKYGFEVDDLYAVSLRIGDIAHSDPTHYNTPEGEAAFSEQVVSCLMPYIEE